MTDNTFDGLLGEAFNEVFKAAERKARIMLYLGLSLSFLVGCAVGVLIL